MCSYFIFVNVLAKRLKSRKVYEATPHNGDMHSKGFLALFCVYPTLYILLHTKSVDVMSQPVCVDNPK